MKNYYFAASFVLLLSALLSNPSQAYSIDWQDEKLFFQLNPAEVVFRDILNRDNGLKVHDSYLYMVRNVIEDGIQREALLRYNFETKNIYEFRYDLLPQTIRYDIGANKLIVPVLTSPEKPPRISSLLIYDLEHHLYTIIETSDSGFIRGFMVLPDNTLITSIPVFQCCGYRVIRRDLETLEIISSSPVGGEGFSHGSRFKVYGNDPYFIRGVYNPVSGHSRVLSYFTSSNTLGTIWLPFENWLNDWLITDNSIIVAGNPVAYHVPMDDPINLGRLVIINKSNSDNYVTLLPSGSGSVVN